MKKVILSLSVLATLGLVGCANQNVVPNDDCCSHVKKIHIPDGPHFENRITTFDVRPKAPEIRVVPSMTIDAKVLFAFDKAILTPEGKRFRVVPSMTIDAKVLFAFDKAILTPEGKRLIASLADSASRNADKSIQLVGSTDFFGTDKYNEKLAEKRAIVVRNEFIKNGVPASKIIIKIYLGQKEQEVIDNCKGDLKECVAPDRNTSMLIRLDM